MANPKRPFFSTSFFTVLGRAGGFVIPLFIAWIYGAGRATDAFFLAYGLLFSLMSVFSHLFESVLVPYLAEEKKKSVNFFDFADRVLSLSLPSVGLLCILIWILLKPVLIRWGSWEPQAAVLAARLFLEMTPLLLLTLWISAGNGILYVNRSFWFPAVSPAIRSVIAVIFLFVFHRMFGAHALTGGFVAGEILRWIITMAFIFRLTGWKFKIRLALSDGNVLIFLKSVTFQILAVIAASLMYAADQWFGVLSKPGDLSLFNYADRLLQIPYILFVTGFLQIYLTDWSETYYHEAASFFWPKVQKDVGTVFLLALVLTGGLWLTRQYVVQLVFGFGRLTDVDLRILADLFGWLILALVPALLRLLYSRVLFVMKKSVFYCVESWVELVAKIGFNAFLVPRFGIVGIAMSTAAVYSLSVLWLFFYLKGFKNRKVDEP